MTEPLWASSLATLPQPDEDERLEEPEAPQEPDEPAPEPRAPASHRRALPVVLVAAVVGVALALADNGGGAVEVKNVSSSWGNVQMRCDTARFETPRSFGGGPRAIEIFNCKPSGNGVLPPGDYSSPRTVWNSDIDQRQAIANRIEITDNAVKGWARY
jgi:hypothetical protein